jgi:hypothetical protein
MHLPTQVPATLRNRYDHTAFNSVPRTAEAGGVHCGIVPQHFIMVSERDPDGGGWTCVESSSAGMSYCIYF